MIKVVVYKKKSICKKKINKNIYQLLKYLIY